MRTGRMKAHISRPLILGDVQFRRRDMAEDSGRRRPVRAMKVPAICRMEFMGDSLKLSALGAITIRPLWRRRVCRGNSPHQSGNRLKRVGIPDFDLVVPARGDKALAISA